MDVRTEVRTYLRGKSKGKSEIQGSFATLRMTTREDLWLCPVENRISEVRCGARGQEGSEEGATRDDNADFVPGG